MTRKERHEDYEGFVEKFKPKKTTDDCYTPPAVYEALIPWIDNNIAPLKGLTIRRPFKPGGDYQAEAKDYGENDVVIDNPPFSILAKIVRYYLANNIRFFLFAPTLTMFNYGRFEDVTLVVVHAYIIYLNGARVNTSFITNMEKKHRVIVDGDFGRSLSETSRRSLPAPQKGRPKSYPYELLTAAHCGRLCSSGIKLKVPMAEAVFIRKVGNMHVRIFGDGLLISERMAAERIAAERIAAERIELSPREREIVRNLSK